MTPRDESTPYKTTVAGKNLYIHAPDHSPPHAHIEVNPDRYGELVVNLITLNLIDRFKYNGAARREVPEILRAMRPLQAELLVAWARLNPKIH